ncbi:MAG: Na+/H+ antiporter subunit C [Anaerolineales bacterium]|nr:Na+/H+ antiporter subunit C [Anaerolineales bacterium]
MEILLAIIIGVLYAAAIYMMLSRSIVKLIIGLALLGHASNLLIFNMGPLVRGRPPLIPEGAKAPIPPFADPLPQALILTAIVIGLGAIAFAIVLVRSVYQQVSTDDIDELRNTER